MASPTQWTWFWVNSGSWWWTGRPGVLRFMGSQSRTRLSNWTDWLNWTEDLLFGCCSLYIFKLFYSDTHRSSFSCIIRNGKNCGWLSLGMLKFYHVTLSFYSSCYQFLYSWHSLIENNKILSNILNKRWKLFGRSFCNTGCSWSSETNWNQTCECQIRLSLIFLSLHASPAFPSYFQFSNFSFTKNLQLLNIHSKK